jgi:hypothetical protein
MSRKIKLYNQVKQNPKNVKFNEICALLELCDYTLRPPSGGSHRWFNKPGCPPINFPEHRPVGEVYIKKILHILEEYGDLEEE